MADGQATQQQGEQGSSACAGCGHQRRCPIYEADGTVHVRYGSGDGVRSVTFIPHQYVEQKQSGSKFVVFVPRGFFDRRGVFVPRDAHEGDVAEEAIAVEVSRSGVDLGPANFGDPLLHAAARSTKVTVVVSRSSGNLTLEEIVLPAVPKPAT